MIMFVENLKCIKVACANTSSFAVTDRGKVFYANLYVCIHAYVCSLLKVFSWGYNSNGELGIGNTSNQTTPKEVQLKDVVTKVNIRVHCRYVHTYVCVYVCTSMRTYVCTKIPTVMQIFTD